MSLIHKILNIFQSDKATFQTQTPEIINLMDFRQDMMSLAKMDRYIARSDYAFLKERYSDTYIFFEIL